MDNEDKLLFEVGFKKDGDDSVVFNPDTWHSLLVDGEEAFGRRKMLQELFDIILYSPEPVIFLIGGDLDDANICKLDYRRVFASSDEEGISTNFERVWEEMVYRKTQMDYLAGNDNKDKREALRKSFKPYYVILDNIEDYLTVPGQMASCSGDDMRAKIGEMLRFFNKVNMHLFVFAACAKRLPWLDKLADQFEQTITLYPYPYHVRSEAMALNEEEFLFKKNGENIVCEFAWVSPKSNFNK